MKMSKDGSGIAVDKEVVKEMADAVLDIWRNLTSLHFLRKYL